MTNLFGTARRAELAFGRRPATLIKDLAHLAETLLPPSAGKLWRAKGLAMDLLKVGLEREATDRSVRGDDEEVDLGRLPALTSWPEDGGAFLTLPLVYTEPPERTRPWPSNLGIYRMQIHDGHTTNYTGRSAREGASTMHSHRPEDRRSR